MENKKSKSLTDIPGIILSDDELPRSASKVNIIQFYSNFRSNFIHYYFRLISSMKLQKLNGASRVSSSLMEKLQVAATTNGSNELIRSVDVSARNILKKRKVRS